MSCVKNPNLLMQDLNFSDTTSEFSILLLEERDYTILENLVLWILSIARYAYIECISLFYTE